jgi:hypothetical protein
MWDPQVIFNLQPLESCPSIFVGAGRPVGRGGGRSAGIGQTPAPGEGGGARGGGAREGAPPPIEEGPSSRTTSFGMLSPMEEGLSPTMTLLHPRRSIPTAHPALTPFHLASPRPVLASTQFSTTLYHGFGCSCASRLTYKERGPLPPKSPDWWERDTLPYKVVMAPFSLIVTTRPGKYRTIA